MAVPDTDDFTLQNVVTEINPTTDDLVDCFADADVNQFDGDYEGDKTQLLNFRNYGAVVCQATTGWVNASGFVSGINNNRFYSLGSQLQPPNPFNRTINFLTLTPSDNSLTYSYEIFGAAVNPALDGTEQPAVSVVVVNNVTGLQASNIPPPLVNGVPQTFPTSFYTVKITANPPVTFTSLEWKEVAPNPAFTNTYTANNITTTCTGGGGVTSNPVILTNCLTGQQFSIAPGSFAPVNPPGSVYRYTRNGSGTVYCGTVTRNPNPGPVIGKEGDIVAYDANDTCSPSTTCP